MKKQDMMKIQLQTCVLRVNIHCGGCMHKVRKKLQKVEGVYKVSIDEEQGKVTVSGNVDPSFLIEKLEKAGKHAELWGPQKGAGPMPILSSNQFKNIQLDSMKDSKKGQKGGGFQIPQQMQMQMQMNQKKGGKEEKFTGKDQKSVKFKLPEEDEEEDDDDFDDEFDEDDDEFDESGYESDGSFGAHQPHSKVAPVGHGGKNKAAAAVLNGHMKSGDGDKKGGKGGKKGGGIDAFLKSILGKAGGKKGDGGKKSKKGECKDDGGKHGKKNGADGKNGAAAGKGAVKNGGGKGKDGWSKKGEAFDEGPKFEGKAKQHGFNKVNDHHKGGSGGGFPNGAMGQMGGFPAVQGLPAMNNGGRFQGMGMVMGPGNPYNQQYMMMMNNQQRGIGQDAYNPMAYMRPHPAMGYGPPPGMGYGPPPGMGYGPPLPESDHYTHMFNDENTESCSIM